MTAKSAPYPPCTVTAFWLKYQDPARCLRRVTQPPHIAGPLAQIFGYQDYELALPPSFKIFHHDKKHKTCLLGLSHRAIKTYDCSILTKKFPIHMTVFVAGQFLNSRTND